MKFLASSFLFFTLGLITVNGQTTYTSIANGNLSANGTWDQGAAPPDPLPVGDSIIVKHDITYDIDQFTVNGVVLVYPDATWVGAGKDLRIGKATAAPDGYVGTFINYGTVSVNKLDVKPTDGGGTSNTDPIYHNFGTTTTADNLHIGNNEGAGAFYNHLGGTVNVAGDIHLDNYLCNSDTMYVTGLVKVHGGTIECCGYIETPEFDIDINSGRPGTLGCLEACDNGSDPTMDIGGANYSDLNDAYTNAPASEFTMDNDSVCLCGTLENGDPCPLGDNGPYPGGYTDKLRLWLKADKGTVGSPMVSIWQDKSGAGNNSKSGGNPQLVTSGLNYNPTVDLDGTNDYFTATADIQSNNNLFFVVGKVGATGISAEGMLSIMDDDVSTTWDGANQESMWVFGRNGTGSNIRTRVNSSDPVSISGKFDGDFHIYTVSMGATNMWSYCDDRYFSGGAHTASLSSEDYYLGARYTASSVSHHMTGEIAEAIHWNSTPSGAQIGYVETYLALKYGITLDNTGGGTSGDYTAPDGTLVWDADDGATYHNNIIGLAREDLEALHQKQSHTTDDSQRIYFNSIAASNSLNGGAFGSDNSYIIMGDNQGLVEATASSNIEKPAGILTRLEREWKVTRTGNTKPFNVDITLSAGAVPGSVTVADLRLLVDDDGDFSNGGTTQYANGGGVTISYSNPEITITGITSSIIGNNSTAYFTIGSVNSNTPLPVEMISFNGDCNDGVVSLEWITNSETNNDYFVIEGSNNGISFTDLGRVSGRGNSSEQSKYNWTNSSNEQFEFYRLNQVDYDGKKSSSDVIKVECEELFEESIKLYPNPFASNFVVEFAGDVDNAEIHVYDQYGREVNVVQSRNSENRREIKLDDHLARGIYVVRITTDRSTVTKQMIKVN